MPDEPWPGEDEPDPRWEVPPDPYEEEHSNGRRRVAVVVLVFAAIVVVLLAWTIWSTPAVF